MIPQALYCKKWHQIGYFNLQATDGSVPSTFIPVDTTRGTDMKSSLIKTRKHVL
jgi:hypothetical protein